MGKAITVHIDGQAYKTDIETWAIAQTLVQRYKGLEKRAKERLANYGSIALATTDLIIQDAIKDYIESFDTKKETSIIQLYFMHMTQERIG